MGGRALTQAARWWLGGGGTRCSLLGNLNFDPGPGGVCYRGVLSGQAQLLDVTTVSMQVHTEYKSQVERGASLCAGGEGSGCGWCTTKIFNTQETNAMQQRWHSEPRTFTEGKAAVCAAAGRSSLACKHRAGVLGLTSVGPALSALVP